MTKFNFVDDYSGLYRSDVENNNYSIYEYPLLWDFPNNSTTASIDTSTYRHSSRFAVEIRNSNTEDYPFESIDFEIPSDQVSNSFSFNAMFKCTSPAHVSIYLFDSNELFSSVEPVMTELSPSEWTACFSNIFEFVEKNRPTYGLKVRVVVSEHRGRIVHFSMPNLVDDRIFTNSTYYNPALRFFPDIYKEIDAEQTSPTYPFFKLWHSLTGVADSVMKEYVDIFSYEKNELPVSIKSQESSSNYDGFSSKLTNPEIMPDSYTEWASMFIGNLVKNGIYITPDVEVQNGITYQIGDTGPAGGKIFITPSTVGNSTGKYFEAAPISAEVTNSWATNIDANLTTAVSGADGTAMGAGSQNTIDIVAQAGNIAASSAAAYCADYTYGGFSDWFLPSLDELAELYTNRVIVGDFSSSPYWSSSEFDPDFVWFLSFNDGTQEPSMKHNYAFVRPVRMFSSEPYTLLTKGTTQNIVPNSLGFKRLQISTRMFGFSAGTKGALKNAARAVVGEDAAVVITPNWDNDQWSIMVRTVTASTPGVSGSGQSSSVVYHAMEPAKPAGYTLLHETLDEITFVLDDNDFGVFDQSVIGSG